MWFHWAICLPEIKSLSPLIFFKFREILFLHEKWSVFQYDFLCWYFSDNFRQKLEIEKSAHEGEILNVGASRLTKIEENIYLNNIFIIQYMYCSSKIFIRSSLVLPDAHNTNYSDWFSFDILVKSVPQPRCPSVRFSIARIFMTFTP